MTDSSNGQPTDTRLTLTRASDVAPARRRSDWGGWRLRGITLAFDVTPDYRYEVDLTDCTDSAEVLDWVAQIAHKSWADDACVAGLIRAIDDIIDVQARLCSCGQHHTITPADVRRLIRAAR